MDFLKFSYGNAPLGGGLIVYCHRAGGGIVLCLGFLSNWCLASLLNDTMLDNIVGNGLAHSVGGAVFCGCLCCENGWIFGKT